MENLKYKMRVNSRPNLFLKVGVKRNFIGLNFLISY